MLICIKNLNAYGKDLEETLQQMFYRYHWFDFWFMRGKAPIQRSSFIWEWIERRGMRVSSWTAYSPEQ